MLCACAKSLPPVSTPPPSQDTDTVWQSYARSGAEPLSPFRTNMSLRYGEKGNTERVTGLLWGNTAKELRLDLTTGVGITVAKVWENDEQFLIYIPSEDIAYYHEGRQKPFFKVGVPIPLNTATLAYLLQGKYSTVFGTQYSSANTNTQNTHIQYTLTDNTMAGTLELTPLGLPIRWTEAQKNGWQLDFTYQDNTTLPHKLTMTHIGTKKQAIVFVKSQNNLNTPFTQEQMQLILPHGTQLLPLETLRKNK